MKNFCEHYLGLLKENKKLDSITDGYFEIETIKISAEPKNFVYLKPRLIFDTSIKGIYAEPRIVRINYKDMRKLGFVIVSRPPKKKWYQSQKVVYKLVKEHFIESSKNQILLIPPEHKVMYDMANKLIRLEGKNVSPYGFGEWIDL